MADDIMAKTRSTSEILGESGARELLQDIFADLHPALLDETREIASIFTPQTAKEFLAQLLDLTALLSPDDSYEATLQKIQGQIDKAEAMRDSLLEQIFKQIRPIERS